MKERLLAAMALLTGVCCGVQDTKYTNQNNAEFAATIADPATQLIDVRSPGDYAAGHIPGAMNIDLHAADFSERIAGLDTVRPVAVYCRSGMCSRAAAEKLAERGFRVVNLDRGIMRWNGEKVR